MADSTGKGCFKGGADHVAPIGGVAGQKGRGKRQYSKGKGKWNYGKGYDGDGQAWGAGGYWEVTPPFSPSDFEGEWLDSLGHTIHCELGGDGRGPLTVNMQRGEKLQVLTCRYDPATGCWACGNAILEVASSNETSRVWITYDGRRSVWRRKVENAAAKPEQGAKSEEAKTPPDLLPWLLVPQRPIPQSLPGAMGIVVEEENGGEEPSPGESKAPAAVEEGFTSSHGSDYDGGRVSAILNVRQVLGADRTAQETLSHLLVDHDLSKRVDEDPLVPSVNSPLWERMAETPRRNALHVVSRYYSERSTSCPIEMVALDYSEVHVGRHKVPCAATDVEALLRRWMGDPADGPGRRAIAMAQVFALYRTIENPLGTDNQRSSLQLSTEPTVRQEAGIQYELFASPFNAVVDNGRFGSRWPHVEVLFGSAGAYPAVIEMFKEDSIIGVHPPFTQGYLSHVMEQSLDLLVGRFKQVQLVVPVRDAPWRSQLGRLYGASFLPTLWDASAMMRQPSSQPVMLWTGGRSELAPA